MFGFLPKMRCIEICLYCRFKSYASYTYTFFSSKIYIIGFSCFTFNILQITFRNTNARGLQLRQYTINFYITFLVTISFIPKDRLLNHITSYACNFLTLYGTVKLARFINLT